MDNYLMWDSAGFDAYRQGATTGQEIYVSEEGGELETWGDVMGAGFGYTNLNKTASQDRPHLYLTTNSTRGTNSRTQQLDMWENGITAGTEPIVRLRNYDYASGSTTANETQLNFETTKAELKIGQNTGGSSISAWQGVELTFNAQGLRYLADYTATFTDRSLVDKAYVDAAITSGAITLTDGNGTTAGATSIDLGGTLTGSTALTGGTGTVLNMSVGTLPGNQSKLSLNGSSSGFELSYGTTNVTGDSAYIKGNGSNPALEIAYYSDNIGGTNKFDIDDTGIKVTLDDGVMVYAADYSSTFTDRSLVDKAYVDAIAQGLTPHADARVATTANLAVTVAGSGGTKTLTATSNGAIVIDGISLASGDRVLVKNQTLAENNGIYTVSTVGDAGTAYVLTRAADYDGSPASEIAAGDFLHVRVGTENATTSWALLAYNGDDPVLETDPLVFTLIASATQLTAGNGITISGGAISVDASTVAGTGLEQRAGGGNEHILDVTGYTPVTGKTVTRKHAETGTSIANGTTVITHNLNTKLVKVAVYDEADDTEVEVGVEATSVNTITLDSGVAFTGSVVVLG
jgi:hypothetical protein